MILRRVFVWVFGSLGFLIETLNFHFCLFWARYKEHHDCLNYLLEKGCPEPTDEEYAWFVEQCDWFVEQKRLTT
tara:strand:- start:3922 stop:4143 length:222 start_codon:yes stop_codon:yes gene_type:complete